jgi:hypothetical protein
LWLEFGILEVAVVIFGTSYIQRTSQIVENGAWCKGANLKYGVTILKRRGRGGKPES